MIQAGSIVDTYVKPAAAGLTEAVSDLKSLTNGKLLVQRFFAGFPVAGAELVCLQSIQNSKQFVNISPNAQVMNADVSHLASWVDQVNASVSNAFVAVQDVVSGCQFVVDIADHQVLHASQVFVAIAPAFVTVDAIGAGCQKDSFSVFEFTQRFVESNNFSRANERKVEWIEIQANPLSSEVRKLQIDELSIGIVFGSVVGLQSDVETWSSVANFQSHLSLPDSMEVQQKL